MSKIGKHMRGHFVAYLALFFALGGTSIAAVNTLPKNSVGSSQIKNGSIQKVDISKRTVSSLRGLRGPRGLTGPTGATGATGATGSQGGQGLPGTQGPSGVVGYVTNTDAPGAIDIDAEPVVCQTAPQVAGSSETARIDDWFSGVPAASAAMTFFLRTVYSTDGGTTWNN